MEKDIEKLIKDIRENILIYHRYLIKIDHKKRFGITLQKFTVIPTSYSLPIRRIYAYKYENCKWRIVIKIKYNVYAKIVTRKYTVTNFNFDELIKIIDNKGELK